MVSVRFIHLIFASNMPSFPENTLARYLRAMLYPDKAALVFVQQRAEATSLNKSLGQPLLSWPVSYSLLQSMPPTQSDKSQE